MNNSLNRILLVIPTVILAFSLVAEDAWRPNAPISGEYDKALAVKCHNGTFVGKEVNGCIQWLGVPFAIPPVGDLRWSAPKLALEGDGVFEAYDFGPMAIQSPAPSNNRIPESEDCLTLNIFKRCDAPTDKKLPVMVWVHGGGFNSGAPSEDLFDGTRFLYDQPEILFVSVTYRMGPLGFLDLSQVQGAEEYPYAANLGLLDQACALQWVKKNIGAFGGDPENVTVFGESAGAVCVSFLPLVQEAKGTFQKVIIESGSVAISNSLAFSQDITRQFMKAAGVEDFDGMRKLTVNEIHQAYLQTTHMTLPTRDGIVVPAEPMEAYRQGKAENVTMMLGTNAEEDNIQLFFAPTPEKTASIILLDWSSFVAANEITLEDWKNVREFLAPSFRPELKSWQKLLQIRTELFFRLPALQQALAHTASGATVYTYFWNQPPKGTPPIIGAFHGCELYYIFNAPAVFRPLPALLAETPGMTPCEHNPALQTEARKMWFAFAKSGNPSAETHPWTPYDPEKRMTMVFGPDIKLLSDPRGEQRKFLEPLTKYTWETTNSYGGIIDFWLNTHKD